MALYRLAETDRDALVALLGWELHRSRQRPRQSAPIRNAEGRLDALDAFQV
ncbi:MAG: hypothetical protein ACO3N4_02745 [Ilumatobacteraceae bacterium]|jgi:hypothetical protein